MSGYPRRQRKSDAEIAAMAAGSFVVVGGAPPPEVARPPSRPLPTFPALPPAVPCATCKSPASPLAGERIHLSAYNSWLCSTCHPIKHASQARIRARLSVDWEAGEVAGVPAVAWRDMASGEFLRGGDASDDAPDPASPGGAPRNLPRKNFPARTAIEQKFLEKIFPPCDPETGDALVSVDEWWEGELSKRTKLIDEISAGGYKRGTDGVTRWPENRK